MGHNPPAGRIGLNWFKLGLLLPPGFAYCASERQQEVRTRCMCYSMQCHDMTAAFDEMAVWDIC